MTAKAVVDCDEGRRRGCRTFCCALIVRLTPEDRERLAPRGRFTSCLDKAPDGYCVFLDRETQLCSVWENRPELCRAYSCNTDPLLQVAVRENWTDVVDLARRAQEQRYVRVEQIRVPEQES